MPLLLSGAFLYNSLAYLSLNGSGFKRGQFLYTHTYMSLYCFTNCLLMSSLSLLLGH